MSAVLSPAEIDFTRMQPEAVRGVQRRDRPVNWEALGVAIENTLQAGHAGQISHLKLGRMKRQWLKAVRERGIEALAGPLRYNYCKARLWMGDFSDYWGWEFRDFGSNGEGMMAHVYWEETWLPKWGGGNCRRLLVIGEQGIGDAVFIASLLPEAMVRCQEVIFECDDRLHTLLERSLPGLKCRSERGFEDRREEYGQIDAFIPSFELMRMFRRSRESFPGLPYLKPDPKRVVELEKYAGRVGVSWKARQGEIDPLALGLRHPISLQYKHFNREIEQPGIDLWHDIEGIVALCSVLERVVTVPTSVHHMAGALGKRTEIVVPDSQPMDAINLSPWDYSLAYGGKLPWYRDAQVFRNLKEWREACDE